MDRADVTWIQLDLTEGRYQIEEFIRNLERHADAVLIDDSFATTLPGQVGLGAHVRCTLFTYDGDWYYIRRHNGHIEAAWMRETEV